MKTIVLTKNQVALVDDSMFDELNKYKWYASWNVSSGSPYAVRKSFGKKIYMHSVVAKTPKGMQTDHINHNTLDNRAQNLRTCTVSENQMNTKKQINNTSGYKGVFKSGRGWKSQISVNGGIQYIGSFKTKEDAARAYDEAAKELHGEYANTNFGGQK